MINKLVIENLKHRWVRTLLSALVVGVQVMSILTLIGLSRGLLNDSAQRARGTGADIFLKPDTNGTILSTGFSKRKVRSLRAKTAACRESSGRFDAVRRNYNQHERREHPRLCKYQSRLSLSPWRPA